MDCKQVHQKAFKFAARKLNGQEQAMMVEHLESCSSCRELVLFMEAFENSIDKEKELTPGPFFFTRLEQRIKNKAGGVASVLKPAFSWALTSLMIFFLLMSLSGGILAGRMADRNVIRAGSTIQEKELFGGEYFLNDSTNYELEKILLSDNR